MRFKQLQQDFKVEEIPSISTNADKRTHSVYLMEKNGLGTFEAIRLISDKLKIPFNEIGYAGLKDKQAITKQYISIPTNYTIKIQNSDNLKLFFVGYQNKKIKIGDLEGNKFSIIIRDIKEEELKEIHQRTKLISQYGFPNYFDSQRFVSVIGNEFIAKYIVEKKYELAVKLYLTKFREFEAKMIKSEKEKILKNWRNLDKITVKNRDLRNVVNEFLKTKNWLSAYKKIQPNLKEMFINAYQSYIWNECLNEILKLYVDPNNLYPIKYNLGYFIFYTKLSEDEIKNIPPKLKTIMSDKNYSDTEKQIFQKILSKQGLKLSDFDIEAQTGNFFKVINRQTIVKPIDFNISRPMIDDINNNTKNLKYAIEVSYSLPKGCYASILIKKVFNI